MRKVRRLGTPVILSSDFSRWAATPTGQLQVPIGWGGYVGSADFWSRTLRNWQSEFLAVASMAILSVYLRRRGSPESRPVGAAHTSTGVEG